MVRIISLRVKDPLASTEPFGLASKRERVLPFTLTFHLKNPVSNLSIFSTPQEAESAFYEALANADLDAMMAIWSDEEEVLCIHPGGPQLDTLSSIRESWKQLFEQSLRMEIRISQTVAWNTLTLSVHNVVEQFVMGANEAITHSATATNVYSRNQKGWRLVMHHATQANPAEFDLPSLSMLIH